MSYFVILNEHELKQSYSAYRLEDALSEFFDIDFPLVNAATQRLYFQSHEDRSQVKGFFLLLDVHVVRVLQPHFLYIFVESLVLGS